MWPLYFSEICDKMDELDENFRVHMYRDLFIIYHMIGGRGGFEKWWPTLLWVCLYVICYIEFACEWINMYVCMHVWACVYMWKYVWSRVRFNDDSFSSCWIFFRRSNTIYMRKRDFSVSFFVINVLLPFHIIFHWCFFCFVSSFPSINVLNQWQ